MTNRVKSFNELTPKLQPLAGGKGGMLARMFQGGYPVPEGFVVLPQAFEGERLSDEAWNEIRDYLSKIRKKSEGALFAVRSSALNEDSARASFAGEFETVLNAGTDKEIQEAIYTVFRSRQSERVKVYSSFQGIEQSHKIAVVVQLMVPSEVSGVLFTADPVTGSFERMIGNYVHGLGEQLVSGEKDAFDFVLRRPNGRYDGPKEFKKYASALYNYATKLEREMGCPQDIEWAVAGGKLYVLQSRPITTLTSGSPDIYEINENLAEDTIWVNTNVAEAIPDVVTPLTWSIVRALDIETNLIPGYYLWSGNICGRIYTNIGKRLSAITAMYGSPKMGIRLLGEVFGQLPENLTIPVWPISRTRLIKAMFPRVKYYLKKNREASKNMPQFIQDTPGWCKGTKEAIKKINTREELFSLWKHELEPYNRKAWWGLMAGGASAVIALTLRKKLIKLTGTEDANALLSNIREDSGLESLGPVIGISKVVKGQMSREEYLVRHGHRGPHEFELSIPDPVEDEAWLDKQTREFRKSDNDVEGLLNRQHAQYQAARKRFEGNFPNKAKWLEKRLKKVSASARIREAARSEFVRVFRVVRSFALKAGELTGIGEDVFFLYINEVEDLLEGDKSALKHIPARKENYEKYKALPTFPSIIRGRFDPFEWAKDPDRRMDYYDASLPAAAAPDSDTIKGFAGAAGRVEGTVRILANPEEGEKLVQGEILVAATTNVGWTPLFPRAAAVITDVGAPLSHAAIVARELGIPAVVGCGNATARLKTGDRVLVDGGQGVVYIKIK
jgi:pyruvate,water dikinase